MKKNNIPSMVRNLKISNFVQSSEVKSDEGISSKDAVYTDGESRIAHLPDQSYKKVIPGALITANNNTRYVLSKNDKDQTVVLNQPVNWYNSGDGFLFEYINPIRTLAPADNVIGFVTRDGSVHISDKTPLNIDRVNIKSQRIYVSSESGLMILNDNDKGLYVDTDGEVYIGSVGDWQKLEYLWGQIDGDITTQLDLMNLLNEKIDKVVDAEEDNLPKFDENGKIIDSGKSLSNLNIDGGTFF